ncbi:MAG: PqqD family peptide modification chaperone [Candidatus Eremiobacteraeota bacterium]|nr:PqqD family peptide modification chaperone [Candidatus Eremiobacteraeota bacterium]
MIGNSPLYRVRGEKGIFIINPDNGGWVIVNLLGDRILSLWEEGHKIKKISSILSEQYNRPFEEIHEDVRTFFKHLEKQNFFSSGIPGDGDFSGLYLEITGRCNLTCKYCYNSPPVPEDIPEDIAISLIDQAKELGARYLVIGGGEPLLYKKIWNLLEYATPVIQTGLVTNGILLTPENCKRLSEMDNLSIQLSLEGVEAEIHEAMRGEGSFQPAWQGLQNLIESGLGKKTTLCFTLNRYNAGHFPEIVEKAGELNIGSILVQPLGKVGKAIECWDEIAPGHSESIPALEYLGRQDFPVYGILPRTIKEILFSHKIRTRCPIGEKFNITYRGDVYPCSQLSLPEFRLGNINNTPLDKILNSEKLKSLQEIPRKRIGQIPECSSCPWRMLCAGGCPASSILENGDINSLDPHCDLIRHFFEETAKELAESGGKA